MKNFVVILLIVNIFYSCEKPCNESETGPPIFRIEIVDVNNQNVFTNGTFTQDQLQVTSDNNSSNFNYFFISEDNLNQINISPAWSEGTFTTTIKLNNEIIIPIITQISKTSNRCKTNYFINKIDVSGYLIILDRQRGVYKIII